ncbi:TonB-dependent receptor domain-containing protein [Pseudomarimonas arenosa]|uniref:TonB-dependent receptor n=1 Tax=Pseudomarimonas arenosa TaxID=2774145 RepID=A0AAW3ZNB8_9GAMM|nr:TonB-dependent receptor [Pseudomarimonas arenosa]MBD8527029.1 TonB-dependent receptor [Pseudomarimonas arenosa]
MNRPALALAALTLATRLAFAAEPADLSLYLFDQDRPVGEVEVLIDGQPIGQTSGDGALHLQLPAGAHRLQLLRNGEQVLQLELQLSEEENARLIATLLPGAEPAVSIESSHRRGSESINTAKPQDSGPPGKLSGRIINSDDGKPVAGARVYISGTPLDISTDAEGRFEVEIASGAYSISVIAANFATMTLDGIAISSNETTQRAIELTPAGFELPEFVVLEPFVEGSLAAFVEEKRTSSAVADILGAEQISRAGDSDAAGALKRVTGLTLVDGKFVYVRGLGERYSSVLLNGAQVPSPDPTRRVVPLDLFPTDVLSGIVVQKTYSAEMPGEFGGGTIQMRTRGVPESFLLRFQGTLGYADGTTGELGLRSAGGGRDWLGRDDGYRAAPDGLLVASLPSRGSEELRDLSRQMAAKGMDIGAKKVGPDTGFAFSVGDDFRFADGDFSLGYIGSTRYSQSFDLRSEQRAEFAVLGDGSLVPQQRFQREKAERAVDTGAFLAVGSEIGEHHRLVASVMQFRQTQGEDRIDEGLRGSGSLERAFSSEWIENQLLTRQVGGEHSLPSLLGIKLDWQYTSSRANRDLPFGKSYVYSFDEDQQDFVYTNSFPAQFRYELLEDLVDESQLGVQVPWEWSEARGVTLRTGGSQLERERDSAIFRYRFRSLVRPPSEPLPIDQIINPGSIDAGQFVVESARQATDFYTAAQTLDAYYLAADFRWDDWRLDLGSRHEDNDQQVVTLNPFLPNAQPIIGAIQQSNDLPFLALTWAYSEAAQLRFGYSETVSRPDFRELSRAPFTDPLLDITVLGNPNLQQADIKSYDLRWEYYFSPIESVSVALFRKEFSNPIELVRTPASGDLLELRNAAEAQNQGIEIDWYRSFAPLGSANWLPASWRKAVPFEDIYLGFNYAYIDSEIDLGANAGIQTSAQRPLQGQSPYVGNLSLSYLPEDGGVEATLLYNVFGERISKVGESGVPDEYEQPFHQLDFTLSKQLPWYGWKTKLRLRNLLDPEVEFTQGSEVSRSYKKGREIALSVEWKF